MDDLLPLDLVELRRAAGRATAAQMEVERWAATARQSGATDAQVAEMLQLGHAEPQGAHGEPWPDSGPLATTAAASAALRQLRTALGAISWPVPELNQPRTAAAALHLHLDVIASYLAAIEAPGYRRNLAEAGIDVPPTSWADLVTHWRGTPTAGDVAATAELVLSAEADRLDHLADGGTRPLLELPAGEVFELVNGAGELVRRFTSPPPGTATLGLTSEAGRMADLRPDADDETVEAAADLIVADVLALAARVRELDVLATRNVLTWRPPPGLPERVRHRVHAKIAGTVGCGIRVGEPW